MAMIIGADAREHQENTPGTLSRGLLGSRNSPSGCKAVVRPAIAGKIGFLSLLCIRFDGSKFRHLGYSVALRGHVWAASGARRDAGIV
jgi:hypothetical protein